MPQTFRTARIVEFADTDMAGIVHFARFFHFMEEAEHALLRSHGLSVMMVLDGVKVGWPRVAAQCDYVTPIRFEDEIAVLVTVQRIGTKSVTYNFCFEKEGQLVAKGTITACCITQDPLGTMRGTPMPAAFRQVFEAYATSA